jgi:hypothetical protein
MVMSDNPARPVSEDNSATPPLTPLTTVPGAGSAQTGPRACNGYDPTEVLKQRLEETRLPADLREKIIAELPSPEEEERLYRELIEQGGMSLEEFLESLGHEVKPQP